MERSVRNKNTIYFDCLCYVGVEVVSGAMFLVPVPNRTAETLFEYMKRYIRRGSIITVGNTRVYL